MKGRKKKSSPFTMSAFPGRDPLGLVPFTHEVLPSPTGVFPRNPKYVPPTPQPLPFHKEVTTTAAARTAAAAKPQSKAQASGSATGDKSSSSPRSTSLSPQDTSHLSTTRSKQQQQQ